MANGKCAGAVTTSIEDQELVVTHCGGCRAGEARKETEQLQVSEGSRLMVFGRDRRW